MRKKIKKGKGGGSTPNATRKLLEKTAHASPMGGAHTATSSVTPQRGMEQLQLEQTVPLDNVDSPMDGERGRRALFSPVGAAGMAVAASMVDSDAMGADVSVSDELIVDADGWL